MEEVDPAEILRLIVEKRYFRYLLADGLMTFKEAMEKVDSLRVDETIDEEEKDRLTNELGYIFCQRILCK